MNPETARWLLSGAHAFQKDNKLQKWEGVSRENFTFLLTSIFKTEAFEEAVRLLEQVVAEELSAPDLPPDLKLLIEEHERAREKDEATRHKAAEDVQKFIESQRRAVLHLAGPVKPGVSRTKLPPPPPKETAELPPEVTEKLTTEDEGVAFTPVYALLQPKVAASFVKKVALTPIVKTLQTLDKISGEELTQNATPEWREMLHQGVTSKDIDTSVLAYQEAGVSPEHPIVKNLEAKRTRVKAYEQSHRLVSGILKHYHEFSKITGRRQIFLPEIKTFLPRLAQAPAWVKRQGYSWRLRQGLNQLGFVFRTHEKIALGPGKTVVKFTLPDKFTRVLTFGRVRSLGTVKSFVYRKTAGAILTRLGKTALGQGIKKGAAWVLTRLGLAAIPTGVTQAIALALVLKDVPKLAKWFFQKLWDNPLLAGVLGAGLLLLPLLLTLPFWLVPILVTIGLTLLGSAILAGAAQIGGAIISGVGGFLGGAAQMAGGFLSSLGTISVPSTIPLMAVGAPAAVGLLTAVVIINTSSAFIEKPPTTVGIPVPYGACSLMPETPGSGALKELFINAGQWAGVPPAIIAGIASVEGKHMFSYSDEQIRQYSAPGAQDPTNCTPNGCGARGPMQFLNDGVATDCGRYTGQVMPDVWGAYKGAVNQAIPGEQRDPNVCNIKDSLYAAAWKVKGDSQTPADQTCLWDQTIVNRVATAYYGETACTETWPHLGNKTYCQYLWDYYQKYNLVQTPSPSGWFFWQADPQWNPPLAQYDTRIGTIASHGCGPTSMAMVLTYFGIATTPVQMWNEFMARGYLSPVGSSWEAIRQTPGRYNLNVQDLGRDWGRAAQKLQEGNLIIASTNLYQGHILVVRGIEGNNVITNDSNMSNGDGAVYTKEGLLMLNLWAIGK